MYKAGQSEEDYSQQVTPARTWKKTIHSRSHQQGHGRRLFTAGHTSKDMEEDDASVVFVICTSRDIFSDDWESSR